MSLRGECLVTTNYHVKRGIAGAIYLSINAFYAGSQYFLVKYIVDK